MAERAYERPSPPIHVTRGSSTKSRPATTAVRRSTRIRVRATVRPAATPVTIALGTRSETGEYGKTSNQRCIAA